MSSDIGYINARIRAMRSYLLQKDNFHEFVNAGDFDSLFLRLENIPSYSESLRRARTQYGQTLDAADSALKENLTNTFRKILNFCAERPKELILLILRRWDVHNLKVVIRGIAGKVSAEKMKEEFIGIGEWNEASFEKACEQRTVPELGRLLRSDDSSWKRGISSMLNSIKEDMPLEEIENRLHQFYFDYCMNCLDKDNFDDCQVLSLLKLEIDFKNILGAVYSVTTRTPVEEKSLIKGGAIPPDTVVNVSKLKNVEEVLTSLAPSYYKSILTKASDIYRSDKRCVYLEKILKKEILSAAARLYAQNALAIGVAVGYIVMKEVEIINLRSVVNGVYYGIMPEALSRELILN